MLKRVHKRDIQPIREREKEEEKKREAEKSKRRSSGLCSKSKMEYISEPNECVLYVYVCDRKKKRDLYEFVYGVMCYSFVCAFCAELSSFKVGFIEKLINSVEEKKAII